MDAHIERKAFTDDRSADAAQRAEKYIDSLPNGAGTWADGSTVDVPTVAKGVLVIRDKFDRDDRNLRHVQLWIGSHLIVTMIYSHDTKRLVRTF